MKSTGVSHLHPCACGCGTPVQNRYKRGHNSKRGHNDGPSHRVGYKAAHGRLGQKTGTCEVCKKTPPPAQGRKTGTQWAFIGNDPKKYSLDRCDYQEMCVSCHAFHDRGKDTGYIDPKKGRPSPRKGIKHPPGCKCCEVNRNRVPWNKGMKMDA